jgi:DNA-binding SARP family transcriptional activator
VVLALLLVRANQVVHLDSLVEELWAGDSPPSAVTAVQTYVYHLRRGFARSGLSVPGQEIVDTSRPGYIVRVAPGDLDVQVFEDQVSCGEELLVQGNYGPAAGVLRDALMLWTGPALANTSPGKLLRAHTVQLEERRSYALKLRIQADMHLGRYREIVGELRSLVVTYPLDEWFHARLIVALSRSGRRGEALQSYQNLRTLLRRELGVDPSPEVQELQQKILSPGSAGTVVLRQRRGDDAA